MQRHGLTPFLWHTKSACQVKVLHATCCSFIKVEAAATLLMVTQAEDRVRAQPWQEKGGEIQ